MDVRDRGELERRCAAHPFTGARISASAPSHCVENFVPYLHAYVERAELNGYDRIELVGQLLELLERVSSRPPSRGGGQTDE